MQRIGRYTKPAFTLTQGPDPRKRSDTSWQTKNPLDPIAAASIRWTSGRGTSQCGQFNTQEDHPWDKPQLKTSRQIRFARPYTVAPKVIVWLNALDMSNAHNVRITAQATDITSTGFTLHIDTWADSILYSGGATWIAVPSDRPHFSTGAFNSQEIRPWDKPQQNHSKQISFAGAGYEASPRVLTGLSSLDFDSRHNLRVKIAADGISAAGMVLHLDSWADTVMYSAGGSYLAIG